MQDRWILADGKSLPLPMMLDWDDQDDEEGWDDEEWDDDEDGDLDEEWDDDEDEDGEWDEWEAEFEDDDDDTLGRRREGPPKWN